MNQVKTNYVFGPVPSRRLGYSLGVDIVPRKVCSLDCVYCQVGRTTVKTVERKEWVPTDRVIENIREAVGCSGRIDYITFSGSGEPTLHSGIGRIIRWIKQSIDVPVAVITNSSLLDMPDVRNDILCSDLVVPSLDAVSQHAFEKTNRPHISLHAERIIDGLTVFRKEFAGKIWLEVMIVRGVNDSAEEIGMIAEVARKIHPDKIQLNSISRPAAEAGIESADRRVLEYAREVFGEKAEIIGEFREEGITSDQRDIHNAIKQLILRRPCTITQISQSLGAHEAMVVKHIGMMISSKGVDVMELNGEKFYKAR